MPITAAVDVIVAALSETARAMPKSMTLTAPSGVIMTLPGFTSRCTMPLPVAEVERAADVGGDLASHARA